MTLSYLGLGFGDDLKFQAGAHFRGSFFLPAVGGSLTPNRHAIECFVKRSLG